MDLGNPQEIASQVVVISSLLAGFSVTIVSNLITSKSQKKIENVVLICATLTSSCFLITTFAMVKIMMIANETQTLEIIYDKIKLANIIGNIFFIIGVLLLCTLVSLFGWIKSKKIGIITTFIGVITFIFIILAMSEFIKPN